MKYDLDYYEGMLRNYSHTAEKIANIRWEFINEFKPRAVLDYGSGVGWFRAFRPKGVEVFTFDVMDVPQTGIPLQTFDVVCFWDVLEHIPDFSSIDTVIRLANNIALTVPIMNGKLEYIGDWKHFKPGEHLHYFTVDTLDAMFANYHMMRIKDGYPECPPREDVWSAFYAKS